MLDHIIAIKINNISIADFEALKLKIKQAVTSEGYDYNDISC